MRHERAAFGLEERTDGDWLTEGMSCLYAGLGQDILVLSWPGWVESGISCGVGQSIVDNLLSIRTEVCTGMDLGQPLRWMRSVDRQFIFLVAHLT